MSLFVNLIKLHFDFILGAGSGGLGLAIEGPSEAKMTCKDNRDGSCSIEYVPTECGDYDISIKFAEEHIPGSPFKVNSNCGRICLIRFFKRLSNNFFLFASFINKHNCNEISFFKLM